MKNLGTNIKKKKKIQFFIYYWLALILLSLIFVFEFMLGIELGWVFDIFLLKNLILNETKLILERNYPPEKQEESNSNFRYYYVQPFFNLYG